MADEKKATTSERLDGIREGGTRIVVSAEDRLRSALLALNDGDFGTSLTRAQEAVGRLGALVEADNQFGTFARCQIIRGTEVEQGMIFSGRGRIIAPPENISEHSDDCPEAIFKAQLEDGSEIQFYAGQEVIIDPEPVD